MKSFVGDNAPYGAGIYYYIRANQQQEMSVTILDDQAKKAGVFKADTSAGLHRLTWKLNLPGTKSGVFNPLPPGNYTAILQAGDRKMIQTFPVEVDD